MACGRLFALDFFKELPKIFFIYNCYISIHNIFSVFNWFSISFKLKIIKCFTAPFFTGLLCVFYSYIFLRINFFSARVDCATKFMIFRG